MNIQRFLLIALVIILLIFGGGALYFKLSQSNVKTTQSALAVCDPDTKKAAIRVSFSNNDTKSFTVTAKDNQTNTSVQMGIIASKAQRTDTIATDKTALKNGTVTFSLSQQNSLIPVQKTVTYTAVSACDGFAEENNTTGTTQQRAGNLPATGTPAWTWFLLALSLPAGFLLKRMSKS